MNQFCGAMDLSGEINDHQEVPTGFIFLAPWTRKMKQINIGGGGVGTICCCCWLTLHEKSFFYLYIYI